jgi:hypothetical protein
MSLLRFIWMIVHPLLCVGAVMLGYDRSMPWWQVLILVSLSYFANDIALLLARLCLGSQRLQRLTAKIHSPPLENY